MERLRDLQVPCLKSRLAALSELIGDYCPLDPDATTGRLKKIVIQIVNLYLRRQYEEKIWIKSIYDIIVSILSRDSGSIHIPTVIMEQIELGLAKNPSVAFLSAANSLIICCFKSLPVLLL